MPRALKSAEQRDARRGTQRCTQDYSEGAQLIPRGYSGLSGVVGCTLGYPLTGLRARAFAELFGFGAFVSDAFRFSLGVNAR
jgi:hypothetical protein